MKIHRIKHDAIWRRLSQAGTKLDCKYLLLEKLRDITPGKKVELPFLEKTFLLNCDKNFVYRWLSNFDHSQIYLNSHPCEAHIWYQFTNRGRKVFQETGLFENKKWGTLTVAEPYFRTLRRWGVDIEDGINVISQEDFMKEIESAEIIDLE